MKRTKEQEVVIGYAISVILTQESIKYFKLALPKGIIVL